MSGQYLGLIDISLIRCWQNAVIFLTHADNLHKKDNEPSQDSYLAAMLAGVFS